MFRPTHALACALALAAPASVAAQSQPATSPVAAPAPARSPIVVDLNPAAPGQEVFLRWYFTGDKVMLSGGRFGKGTPVTGLSSISDRPLKTTVYTFDLTYKGKEKDPATGAEKVKTYNARYTATVKVAPLAPLAPYKAKRGWAVWHLKPWKPDPISSAAYGRDYLVFFQNGDDALERLAVAVIPSELMTTEAMLAKIRSDAMNKYEAVEIVSQRETTHFEAPALLAVVKGRDPNHGMTRSVVLAFVRDGQAYYVSARTSEALYPKRQVVMENMVRSLTVPSRPPATAAARPTPGS